MFKKYKVTCVFPNGKTQTKMLNRFRIKRAKEQANKYHSILVIEQ